jgi:hypothetical protein
MSLLDNHIGMGPMAAAVSGLAREIRWLSHAGLAVMAAAFVWWLLFYAQWTGPLRLLDLKVPCLVTTLGECSFFQSRLDAFHAAGPVYQPAAWWIGMAAFMAGRISGMLLPVLPSASPLAGRGGPGSVGLRRDSQKDGALRD